MPPAPEQPDTSPRSSDEWTPGRGILRGFSAGLVATLILCLLVDTVAWYAPLMTTSALLRAALGFGCAWIIFGVVQRRAGMVGGACTIISIGLSSVVPLSTHAVFAVHGVLLSDGNFLSGSKWFDPVMLLVLNWPAIIGIVGCAWLRHDGGADAGTLVDILRTSITGP